MSSSRLKFAHLKNTYKSGNVYDNNDSENTNTKVANTENKAKNLNLKKDGKTTPNEVSNDKNSSSNPNRNEKVAVAKNVEKNVNIDVGEHAAGPRGPPPLLLAPNSRERLSFRVESFPLE